MSVRSVYLDTNAIVERYVVEEHTDRVNELYDKAHAGELIIGFSTWNIGELAGVLDKYERMSAKGFDAFLTYDKRLAQVARIEGLNVIA